MKTGLKALPDLSLVGHYISPAGGSLEPHQIPTGRVYFEILIDGSVYGFEPTPILHPVGTVFVHHEGDFTVSRTKGDRHYVCVYAWCELDGESPARDWPRCFYWEDAVAVRKFSDEILRAFHDGVIETAMINELLWAQLQFRVEHHRTSLIQRQMPASIASTIAYIESNYADDLSVDSLAERASMSASHLQATFRRHARKSIRQYLIEVRMSAAVHALLTTDAPIKSVALDAGYANTENFCRAFKKRYGLTAASYRLKYRRYEDV